MLSVSCRLYVTDQFWNRGSVRPSGGTAMTAAPRLIVGSMNGGNWILSSGKPESRWCAGKMPLVLFGANGLDEKFVVLHAGNIGLGQNLDVVIEAAGHLRSRTDILLLFIGDGSRRAELEQIVAARGLGNVRFLPFQPRDQLRWTYASSDVCLVSLKPGLAGYIVPSKLYPILAAGRPYIAAVEAVSEVAALTERHRCGVLVTPGDSAQMAAEIVRLADQRAERESMGARARIAAELFGRERQVAAHAQVIEEVADRS